MRSAYLVFSTRFSPNAARQWRGRRRPLDEHQRRRASRTRRKTFAERDREKIRADRETISKRLLSVSPPAGFKLRDTQNSGQRWPCLPNRVPEAEEVHARPPITTTDRPAERSRRSKPCFMMSPLSLAKFAAPRALEFDVAFVVDRGARRCARRTRLAACCVQTRSSSSAIPAVAADRLLLARQFRRRRG